MKMMLGFSTAAHAGKATERNSATARMANLIASMTPVRGQIHLRITKRDGLERLVIPIRIARPREAQYLALPRHCAFDEPLQLGILTHPRPQVIARKRVRRGTPDEMVGKARS